MSLQAPQRVRGDPRRQVRRQVPGRGHRRHRGERGAALGGGRGVGAALARRGGRGLRGGRAGREAAAERWEPERSPRTAHAGVGAGMTYRFLERVRSADAPLRAICPLNVECRESAAA